MEFNENFYHNALRSLQIGTSKENFAETYANSSNEQKGSSIWNELYKQGEQVFGQYVDIVDANGTVDENEFNLFTTILNFFKNLPSKDDEYNTPSFQGHISSDSPMPIDSIGEQSLDESMNIKDRKEAVHLKSVEVMSREELIEELKVYDPKFDISKYKDDTELRGELTNYRKLIAMHDENSNIIDFHIGTFSQGKYGTCAPLSIIASLTDEELKDMVKEGTDEKGKFYLVTFPMDKNNPEFTQKIYEQEVLDDQLHIDGFEGAVSGFSVGDADVRLLEMAYAKRFGLAAAVNGVSPLNVSRVFTSPDEQLPEDAVPATEQALIEASKKGHTVIGLTYWSKEDENMSYTDVVTSSSGITAKWGMAKNRHSMENTLKLKFPQIDESKYKNLSDQEFLEFVMLLEEGQDRPMDKEEFMKLPKKERYDYMRRLERFTYTQRLELSNGQIIRSDHAYTFRSYNPDTKEVIISDPSANHEDITIPLEIAEKFFRIVV